MVDFDCQRCGACCCNPLDNQAIGYLDYVEIRKRDNILHKPRLLERVARQNEQGQWHIKLTDGSQRCVALEGRLGARVRCTIYADRPGPCRQVQAGTEACRKARAERGLG